MYPFLLEFVDSQAFEFIMWLLLIAAVVGAIFWVLAFFLGARFLFQSWRQLRAAVTRRQRFRAAAQLLAPVVAVSIWQLYNLGSTHYEAKHQAKKWAELQQKVLSVRTASIGNYKLADSGQPNILATTSKIMQRQQMGHNLADTVFVAEKSASPYIELILRADSSFAYRSNIVGDATGAIQQGIWKVECPICTETPPSVFNIIKNYSPIFYIITKYGGYKNTNTLISINDKGSPRFMGSCNQQERFIRFDLKRFNSEAASATH